MGGRGASLGISERGNPYGSQYKTVLKSGNIKFVEPRVANPESLLETMTRGRIYVLLGQKGPKNIIYFDNELKRNKRIDLDHFHKGLKPHTQKGYYGPEGDNGKLGANKPTTEEKKMVARVNELWDNYLKSKK